MAPATKSRRGGKKSAAKGKKVAATKAAASTDGGEKLTVAERRLQGASLGDRRKAVKMVNGGDSINDVAEFLDMSPIKAKYLVMQQQVEDGDVPAIKPTDEKAILKALKADDDYSSVAWIACRTGLADGKVKAIAEQSGHSFDRGRPKTDGGGAKKAASSSKVSATKGKTGSRARRGSKARRGRKASSPNA